MSVNSAGLRPGSAYSYPDTIRVIFATQVAGEPNTCARFSFTTGGVSPPARFNVSVGGDLPDCVVRAGTRPIDFPAGGVSRYLHRPEHLRKAALL